METAAAFIFANMFVYIMIAFFAYKDWLKGDKDAGTALCYLLFMILINLIGLTLVLREFVDVTITRVT